MACRLKTAPSLTPETRRRGAAALPKKQILRKSTVLENVFHSSLGNTSAGTMTLIERACPGVRWISPLFSRVSTI